jgi:hypothetical protein
MDGALGGALSASSWVTAEAIKSVTSFFDEPVVAVGDWAALEASSSSEVVLPDEKGTGTCGSSVMDGALAAGPETVLSVTFVARNASESVTSSFVDVTLAFGDRLSQGRRYGDLMKRT